MTAVSKTYKLAVLLTCFNRREKTRQSLINLFDQALPDTLAIKVFVCDDGSRDGTGEMLAQDFPQVNVVQGNGNLYWGGGMRKAWESAKNHSQFDAFLWLNDDTFLLPDALRDLWEEYMSLDQPAILSASCKVPGKEEFSYGGHLMSMKPVIPNGAVQRVDLINGNLTLIAAEVEDAIGNISPVYTHFLGDFDYGLRAQKAGFPCFTTSKYLAECEANPMPNWHDPKMPLRKRWEIAHDVKGMAISEFLAFKTYHQGKWAGFKARVDIYLKLIFTDRYVKFRNSIHLL